MPTEGRPVFAFSLPRGRLAPLSPVSYATADYTNVEEI